MKLRSSCILRRDSLCPTPYPPTSTYLYFSITKMRCFHSYGTTGIEKIENSLFPNASQFYYPDNQCQEFNTKSSGFSVNTSMRVRQCYAACLVICFLLHTTVSLPSLYMYHHHVPFSWLPRIPLCLRTCVPLSNPRCKDTEVVPSPSLSELQRMGWPSAAGALIGVRGPTVLSAV